MSGANHVARAIQLLEAGDTYPQGCSGFVSKVLGRSWLSAAAYMGDSKDTNVSAGDVVGWRKSDGQSHDHVGIYIGPKDFIYVSEPYERAAIFSPHLSGPGQSNGVWAGGRTTNTKQSKTLFVTNVDPRVMLEQVAALFKDEPGFFAFRTVRRMCFVDFHSIAEANMSMRKYQNHVFHGLDPADAQTKKLLIDYDKDDVTKRNTQFAAQVGREISSQENGELIELTCMVCKQFCLKLRIPSPKTFQTLPRRPIDQTVVIETNKYVTELQLGKGDERALKRPAGIEMQYRLICKSCQLPVAYSSTPFESKIKHIFLLNDALRGHRKLIRNGKMVRGEEEKFEITAPISSTPSAADTSPSSSSTASTTTSSSTVAAAAAENNGIASPIDPTLHAIEPSTDVPVVSPPIISSTESLTPQVMNEPAVPQRTPMEIEPPTTESATSSTPSMTADSSTAAAVLPDSDTPIVPDSGTTDPSESASKKQRTG